jgi:N-acetylneuraminate synthase
MGITSLERHITLDRSMYGSDQSASIEPGGFKMLISGIREIEKAKGDGKIEFLEKEKPISDNLRQHLKY